MTKHILILIDQPIQILRLGPQRPRKPIPRFRIMSRRIGIIAVVRFVDYGRRIVVDVDLEHAVHVVVVVVGVGVWIVVVV